MRKPWDDYFMDLAMQVSTRSTCPRKQVGCVIVKDKTIIATGYNGSLQHSEHCTDFGCFIEDNHCIRTVHAETNAINQAAKNGVSLKDASIYCNVEPCWNCFKNIISAGITAIYFKENYSLKNKLYAQYLIEKDIIFKKI